jgi:hypothetical protein
VGDETQADRARGKRQHFDAALQESGAEKAASLKLLDRMLGAEQPRVDTARAANKFNMSAEGRAAARVERYEAKHTEKRRDGKRGGRGGKGGRGGADGKDKRSRPKSKVK